MPEEKDGSKLFKEVAEEVYAAAMRDLRAMREAFPSYRDDQLLMRLLCLRMANRPTPVEEVVPSILGEREAPPQLLGGLGTVPKYKGSPKRPEEEPSGLGGVPYTLAGLELDPRFASGMGREMPPPKKE